MTHANSQQGMAVFWKLELTQYLSFGTDNKQYFFHLYALFSFLFSFVIKLKKLKLSNENAI